MTLNQILKLVRQVSENHSQVNKFLFSKDWDFESEGVVTYPLVGCALVSPASFIDRTLEYDLTIYVADLVHKDRSNEQEVLSDTIQIAQDIIAVLDSPTYDDEVINTKSINYTPFTEKWDSEVSGWTFDLKVKVASKKDWCSVPVRGSFPTPSSSDGVKIIDQNGNVLTTLYDGSIYTVEVLTQIIQSLNTITPTIIQTLT